MTLDQLLFSHEGRITRSQWWFGTVLALLITTIAGWITHTSIPHHWSLHVFSIHNVLMTLIMSVFLFVVHLALNVKRFHDINRHGRWAGLCLLPPPVGTIIAFIFCGLIRGNDETNEYGSRTGLKLFSG